MDLTQSEHAEHLRNMDFRKIQCNICSLAFKERNLECAQPKSQGVFLSVMIAERLRQCVYRKNQFKMMSL